MQCLGGASIRAGKIWIGENELDSEKLYRVAASDFELEPFFTYTNEDWNLDITYDTLSILREGMADYFAKYQTVTVKMGRLEI